MNDVSRIMPTGFSPRATRTRYSIKPVTVIVIFAVALVFLGLTVLFSASASFKQGPFYYISKQLGGIAMAATAAWIISRMDLEYLRRHVWVVAGGCFLMLVFVLIPGLGVTVNGSRRWLGFGPARFQVSEFAKLGLVFCLSHYLALNQTRIHELKRGYLIPVGMIGLCAGLIILEPDFGTAALALVVGVILLFLAGAKWRFILPTVGVALLGFVVLVINNPNRLHRFLSYLDVEGNKQDGTYQLYQSLASFAAGGVDGAGLGQGRQQQYFLPEAHTDFIFAVIGEELGLIFTIGAVVCYLIIFLAGVLHLRKAPNLFQYLLAAGCVLLISLQALVNLGVVTGMLPTKGMSLPFISAGMSNLILMGMLLGVLLNTQRTWSRPIFSGERRMLEDFV